MCYWKSVRTRGVYTNAHGHSTNGGQTTACCHNCGFPFKVQTGHNCRGALQTVKWQTRSDLAPLGRRAACRKKIKHDWAGEVQTRNEYADYRDQIQKILTELHFMSDEHSEQIKIVKHRIKETPKGTQPIRAEPFRAESRARQFGKAGSDKMVPRRVIEPARTKWAAPERFAWKKDESINLFRKL